MMHIRTHWSIPLALLAAAFLADRAPAAETARPEFVPGNAFASAVKQQAARGLPGSGPPPGDQLFTRSRRGCRGHDRIAGKPCKAKGTIHNHLGSRRTTARRRSYRHWQLTDP